MTITRALIVDSSKLTQAITCSFLEDLDIEFDIAPTEQDVWQHIKTSSAPYDLVLVSRASLGKDLKTFVSRFRALRGYSSTPLILLLNDRGQDDYIESLYVSGFTQIFTRKEFDLLKGYIEQSKARDTFEEARQNKVIIIEDDLAQQMTVQAILEENFCECFCFKSAEEALEQVDIIQPHVITCDFFLEGKMTALDFVCHLKQGDHPWSQVPILVMTGLDDATRKYELVRSGANDYIAKPIDPLDLTVRVENLIRYKHLLNKVEKQKQEMQYLAMHDQLTGVYNRHFVAEQVEISIKNAQRHATPYSIVVLDIDFFKKINDQHGHDVGDEVLKAVALLLKDNMRGDDVVARMGGEEFLLLMNHCDLSYAVNKSEILRAKIQALNPSDVKVTASFGVAQLDEYIDSFDKLFRAADQAVYQSKSSGRNCVQAVDSITTVIEKSN
ncbi:MAG: diguanylate cyclase [Cellvibrionaceae bacterium]